MTSRKGGAVRFSKWLARVLLAGSVVGCGAGDPLENLDGNSKSEICEEYSCSGHGSCFEDHGAPACECNPGYIGVHCGSCDQGYHRDRNDDCARDVSCDDDNPCGEHGACVDSSGEPQCECEPGYAGEHCDDCYAGYHPEGEECVLDTTCEDTTCSGHGTCHLRDGEVSCACDGAYTGSNCERCNAGYHRDDHDNCIQDLSCSQSPGHCGVHGSCNDAGGELSCDCDVGYTGARCESCYPGYHPEGGGVCVLDETCLPLSCSGHGTCSDQGGVVGCACDDGYAGEACQDCAPTHHRDEAGLCALDDFCGPVSCGGHGACDHSTGVVRCTCDPGYTGATCRDCYPGYHHDGAGNCIKDDRCTPTSCAGHGDCTTVEDDVQCKCHPGYAGLSCATCATGFHRDEFDVCVPDAACLPESCGPHGACDDTTGVVRCICEFGYVDADCRGCYPGYHADGDDCVLDSSCLPTTCPKNSTCDDTGDVPRCVCHTGYSGSHCQSCAAGFHRGADDTCVPDEHCSDAPNFCSDHGSCSDATGVRACSCDEGYQGDACDACALGYEPAESGSCVPETECTEDTCPAEISTCDDSGDSAVCDCVAGYSGSHCQTCAVGYHRDASDHCVPNESCEDAGPAHCGAHGHCDDASGAVVCSCEDGYFGDVCEDCSPSYYCSAHATDCEVTTEGPVCTCEEGYAGKQCDSCAADYHEEGNVCVANVPCGEVDPCGEHGSCDASSGTPECTCDTGYAGELCAACDEGYHAVGDTCVRDDVCSPAECSGHGKCSVKEGSLSCSCHERYAGDHCELCAPGFERIGDICALCSSGVLTFNTFPGIPALSDTCVKRDPGPVWYQGVTFQTLAGDNQVLSCAASTIYAITSPHVRLLAGNTTYADLIFDGPVVSVSFHYTSKERSATFEFLADGAVVETAEVARRTQYTFSRSFTPAITKLSIRNANANGTEIAIDDLVFDLEDCD